MSTPQNPSSEQQPANNQQSAENNLQQPRFLADGPVRWVEHHYKRLKENAETFPYVWASYAVVYGGFGLWFTYRWRKLRATEDRVRVLQARLRKIVEAEELATSKPVPVVEAEELATSKPVPEMTATSTAKPEMTATSTAVPEPIASYTITKAEESAASATVTDKAAI